MEAIEILNQHKLRVTKARLLVLNFLMAQQKAFSHADLETQFQKQINRIFPFYFSPLKQPSSSLYSTGLSSRG